MVEKQRKLSSELKAKLLEWYTHVHLRGTYKAASKEFGPSPKSIENFVSRHRRKVYGSEEYETREKSTSNE